MNKNYLACLKIAIEHFEKVAQVKSPDFSEVSIEYLTLRLGNQLFFIRLLCEGVFVPGSISDLVEVSKLFSAHPCLLPLKKEGNTWIPVLDGFGLIDAQTKKRLHPPTFVTDEKILLTEAEKHDLAVQFMRGQLELEGRRILRWDASPLVQPSIWFDENEWLAVLALSYPKQEAPLSADLLKALKPNFSKPGYVAFVSLASENLKEVLYRGSVVRIFYEGYYPVTDFLSRCQLLPF